jgi:hypothetical protein
LLTNERWPEVVEVGREFGMEMQLRSPTRPRTAPAGKRGGAGKKRWEVLRVLRVLRVRALLLIVRRSGTKARCGVWTLRVSP